MKIKQMIEENHKYADILCNPKLLFISTLQTFHLKHGYENTLATIYQLALQVAIETNCYLNIEPNSGEFGDDTFVFWSKSLGETQPNISELNKE